MVDEVAKRFLVMHFSGCGVALTSRETETRPGTDPGTGFLELDRNRNGRGRVSAC